MAFAYAIKAAKPLKVNFFPALARSETLQKVGAIKFNGDSLASRINNCRLLLFSSSSRQNDRLYMPR